MIDADRALWRTVLVHGLHEHARGRDTGWIDSKDFHTVCALAGVDGEAVLRCYRPERFMRLNAAA